MFEQAEEALHMAVNLTTQLLTFSKGGKPVKKKMALRPIVESAAKFALSGFGEVLRRAARYGCVRDDGFSRSGGYPHD